MKKHRVSIAILAGIICVAMMGIVLGEETLTLYMENDGGYIKPLYSTDRHYTNGTKIAFTQQPDVNFLKDYSRWNDFGKNDGEVNTALGYFFGQNMYTPDHVDDPAKRVKHDMVFAGWMYGGIFAQRASENQMEHLELNIGMIGPVASGGEVQGFVHHFMGVAEAKGWDNQLKDEFETDVTWLRRQRVDEQYFKRTENFDAHLEYGATVGTLHRNANLGIVFRYGMNLPNDFGPGRLEAPASACIDKPAEVQSAYIFTRIGGKLVEYNRFLTGLTMEPAVGQLQIGAAYRYKSFEMSYSQTFLTREYKEQGSTDSYGAINLTWRF
ncbi:MAG: lipid A deacylase LpxR family protein [Sedimentisphaerales bacterium]